MAKILQETFAADGSSDTVLCSSFTILAGSDGGTNFGGGTLTAEVSHDGVVFTSAHSFTEEEAQTSIDYVGGVLLKLTLAGATSPDLDVSVKYE